MIRVTPLLSWKMAVNLTTASKSAWVMRSPRITVAASEWLRALGARFRGISCPPA